MSKIQEKNRFIGQRFQNLLSHSFTGLCISRRRLSACVRESGSSTAAATPADGSLIRSLSLQSASTNWEQKFCNSHNPRLCKAWEMVKHFHSCLMPHHKLNKRLRKKTRLQAWMIQWCWFDPGSDRYEDCTLKVIRLYRLSLDIQKLKDLCWKLTWLIKKIKGSYVNFNNLFVSIVLTFYNFC